jgi:CRP/FNR family cyclic AMP-dependent transcriptional regulator
MNARAELVDTQIWAADLTEAERERAARGMSVRGYARGAYVCHRGDRLDSWTGVISGLVKMSSIAESGKPVTFAGLGRGGWFGEGSVLKDEPRKYDLVALRETRLAMMNRPTFMWLYDNSIGFNHFLLRQINERLGQFIATVEHDRMLGPKARVARNLAWLFNPVLYPAQQKEIEITQDELALLAGLSRAVVNRCLGELQEEGLIAMDHAAIRVPDVARLARYGDGQA